MSALIIDTNVYSGFMRGEPRAVRVLRAAHEIHLPLIVLAELLAGFAAGARPQKNRDELARFMASPRVHAADAMDCLALCDEEFHGCVRVLGSNHDYHSDAAVEDAQHFGVGDVALALQPLK